MSDRMKIAQLVHDLLTRNKPLLIMSVVGVQGSAPRHTGSRMVVDADGNCHGTIGGGQLEGKAIKQAASVLKDQASCCMRFRMDNPGVNSEGMICGGQAQILLDYVVPSDQNRSHFQALCELTGEGRNHAELTLLHGPEECYRKIERGIALADGTIMGSISLLPNETEEIFACLSQTRQSTLVRDDDCRLLIEPSIPIVTLYCMGAGHVAKPTAHIASMTGFRVVVIDDRPEFANAERFPEAARIEVIQDYQQSFDRFHLDRHSFVAIITRGHHSDRKVLQQALKTKAGYIGLMGSKRKSIVLLESLSQDGFSKEDINRVHSPIGMSIRAETPAELAVSIVAELIEQRGILQTQP